VCGLREWLFFLAEYAESRILEPNGLDWLLTGLRIMESGVLFEDADEFWEVGANVDAFGQDMQVTRHCAVGVQAEKMVRRLCEGTIERETSSVGIGEIRISMMAANGYEIGAGADVFVGREAGVLTMKGHEVFVARRLGSC
jgi:hypothetical protein